MQLNDIAEKNLDKTFDKVVRALPIPELAEEGIIAVKNLLKNDKFREKIKEVLDKTINKDGITIDNITEIKEIIKSKNIKEGILNTIDEIINKTDILKKIDNCKLNILKENKELILDSTISDELNNIYNGQEKVLNTINIEYAKWEKEFNKMNINKMNKIYEKIKEEYEKLIPSIEIINKIKEMDNIMSLAKSKLKNGENTISELEKEICRKAG